MNKKRLVLIVVLVWSALCLGLYYFLVFREQPLQKLQRIVIKKDSSRLLKAIFYDTSGKARFFVNDKPVDSATYMRIVNSQLDCSGGGSTHLQIDDTGIIITSSSFSIIGDSPMVVYNKAIDSIAKDSSYWQLHMLSGGMYERPTDSAGYRIWAYSLHRTVKKRKKKTSHPLLLSGAPIEHAELSEGRLDSLFKFDPKLTHCCFLWQCDLVTKIYCCTDGVVMNWDSCRAIIKGDTVKAIRFIARGFDSLWRLSCVLQRRLDSLEKPQKKGGKK